jgi:hypothetical protein
MPVQVPITINGVEVSDILPLPANPILLIEYR